MVSLDDVRISLKPLLSEDGAEKVALAMLDAGDSNAVCICPLDLPESYCTEYMSGGGQYWRGAYIYTQGTKDYAESEVLAIKVQETVRGVRDTACGKDGISYVKVLTPQPYASYKNAEGIYTFCTEAAFCINPLK